MEWSNEHTFKAEDKLDASSDLAGRVYRQLARCLIEDGAGAVSLFGTIKGETKSVVSIHSKVLPCAEFGRSLWSWRSSSDQGHERGWSANVYQKVPNEHLEPAILRRAFCPSFPGFRNIVRREALCIGRGKGPRLIEPILTPRFVPKCSNTLLHGLGELAAQGMDIVPLHTQGHFAESEDRVA